MINGIIWMIAQLLELMGNVVLEALIYCFIKEDKKIKIRI